MDGLAYSKAVFDKYGPGSKAKQLGSTVSLMDEKQSAEETPEEFAERMDNANNALDSPISSTLMCQFFIRGLHDADLKKYLVQQQLIKGVNTLDDLKELATEYQIHDGLVHRGIDGMSAGLQRGGQRSGRGRGFNSNFRGRGRGRGGFPGKCDFCEKIGHTFRMCRYLNRSLRLPNTSPEQHAQLDAKSKEFMEAASPRDRQKFQDHLKQQTEVGAAYAQPEQIDAEFPHIHGQQAEVKQLDNNNVPDTAKQSDTSPKVHFRPRPRMYYNI